MALEALIPWNRGVNHRGRPEINHKLDDIYKDTTASDWGQCLNDNGESPRIHGQYLTHNGVMCIQKIEKDEEGDAIYRHHSRCATSTPGLLSAMHYPCLVRRVTIEYKIRASLPIEWGTLLDDYS